MGAYDLLAASAAAIFAVLALWVVRQSGGIDRGGPRGELITYFGVAGIAAFVCAIMNILEFVGGGIVAAAVGNATNVLAPAMTWAGARRLNGRAGIGAVTAGACGLLMLAASFVVPLDDATLLKTAGIAAFCALTAAELRRAPLRTTAGTTIMSLTLGLFAVYNAGRLVIAFGIGMDSWVWHGFASAEVTSIFSAVVILAMTGAAMRMGRDLADDPAPGTRAHGRTVLRTRALELLADDRRLVGLTVRIPELDLIRAAHGIERADAAMSTVLEATTEALPEGSAAQVSRDTVVALLTADAERAGIDRTIAEAFARLSPRQGEGEIPDLRILHRGVADRAGLDAFLDAAAGRARNRAFSRR